MTVEFIEIKYFRNLETLKLTFSPAVNVIYGNNGGGKTSLLEAIYYLSLGRSFRSHLNSRIIQNNQEKLSVFAKVNGFPVGIERHQDGSSRMRLSGEDIKSLAELATVLPVQIINPDAYCLLNDGPKFRREFIDWGLFHVEPGFLRLWKDFQRVLKQRNLALKMRAPREEIQLWNKSFCEFSEKITEMRDSYLVDFKPKFLEILSQLLEVKGLDVSYSRGWGVGNLGNLLETSLRDDFRLGHTQNGPHRADLEISINGIPAKDVLSRGQQKLFVYALRLAQGILLQEKAKRACVYLIDDLPAELDGGKRGALFDILLGLKAQVFVTGVELASMTRLAESRAARVFHVEQGAVKECEAEQAAS